MDLLTPWFQPRETAFGLVASRTVREDIFVVLSQHVYGSLLQWPWETNTVLPFWGSLDMDQRIFFLMAFRCQALPCWL